MSKTSFCPGWRAVKCEGAIMCNFIQGHTHLNADTARQLVHKSAARRAVCRHCQRVHTNAARHAVCRHCQTVHTSAARHHNYTHSCQTRQQVIMYTQLLDRSQQVIMYTQLSDTSTGHHVHTAVRQKSTGHREHTTFTKDTGRVGYHTATEQAVPVQTDSHRS